MLVGLLVGRPGKTVSFNKKKETTAVGRKRTDERRGLAIMIETWFRGCWIAE